MSLTVLSALATRENVVRVFFSQPIYFSQLLDVKDGSSVDRYNISIVSTSVGADGLPARPVRVAEILVEDVDDTSVIDVVTDRPFSPYAAQYIVTVNGVWTADQVTALDVSQAAATFYGAFKVLVVPTPHIGMTGRDVANPQSQSSTNGLPNPNSEMILGKFVVDDTGDYAFDDGLTSYKKRILRRLMTSPGGFAHLGEKYGVGIPDHSKKLAQSSVLATLTAEAEKQIAQEPETQKVVVKTIVDPSGNGLVKFIILASTKTGLIAKFAVPFSI